VDHPEQKMNDLAMIFGDEVVITRFVAGGHRQHNFRVRESSLDLSLATELGLAPETDKNQRKYHIENHNLCPKTPSPAAGGELKRKAC
jgi:hypothetical protein